MRKHKSDPSKSKHALTACAACRARKVRCSGQQPCERCLRLNKQCIFLKFTRYFPKLDKKEEDEEDIPELPKDEPMLPLEVYDRREVVLADGASARFLMNVFTNRVLPYFLQTHNLPEASSFLASLEQPRSLAAAMQRDGALALACRSCGHIALSTLLIDRMDQAAAVVKMENSYEAFSSFVLYFMLVGSENIEKGMGIAQAMFSLHRGLTGTRRIGDGRRSSGSSHSSSGVSGVSGVSSVTVTNLDDEDEDTYDDDNIGKTASLPPPSSSPPPMDPVEALCSPLQQLDLSQDPFRDGITPEEIAAHVQHAALQFVTWSKTLEDVRLRHYVSFGFNMRSQLTAAKLRPAATLVQSLTVDAQLLGLILPPYMEETMRKYDPQNRFILGAFCSPRQGVSNNSNGDGAPAPSLEPPVLPPALASMLLRRIQVAHRLLAIAELSVESILSFVFPLELVHASVLLRSGNGQGALAIARSIIKTVSSYDLNFWPPLVTQCVYGIATTFFEVGDVQGIDMAIGVLSQMQRSNPSAACGVAALTELRARIVEEQRQLSTFNSSSSSGSSSSNGSPCSDAVE